MQFSQHDYKYYSALHDVFSADYHVINQYVLDIYMRPKQFIDETGPSLDRFLREYTIPGAPRPAEVPTHTVLEFISQIDEFTAQTTGLFDEHKVHVDMCADYMKKVTLLRERSEVMEEEVLPEFTDLTPELLKVHQGLKTIKDKADSMAERLEHLQQRWAGIKGAINR